jgi:hypothetical protein
MKRFLLLIVSIVLPAGGALAHGHDASSVTVNSSSCNSPARWADRFDTRDARLAITTQDGDAVLLLTDDVVAFQLSDRCLSRLKRELRRDEDADDDNAIARAFKAVVYSGVRTLVAHSAECPVRDLRDVTYDGDRLRFYCDDCSEPFPHIDVDSRDVNEGFSPADARAFVHEFRRLKSRSR